MCGFLSLFASSFSLSLLTYSLSHPLMYMPLACFPHCTHTYSPAKKPLMQSLSLFFCLFGGFTLMPLLLTLSPFLRLPPLPLVWPLSALSSPLLLFIPTPLYFPLRTGYRALYIQMPLLSVSCTVMHDWLEQRQAHHFHFCPTPGLDNLCVWVFWVYMGQCVRKHLLVCVCVCL